jgi:hypothetical protein
MNNTSLLIRRTFPIAVIAPALSGCEAIGTIFKAGVWAGVFGVLVVVVLVGFLVMKMRS